MNSKIFGFIRLMDEAGDGGGAGDGNPPAGAGSGEPSSAAAAIAAGAGSGVGDGKPGAEKGNPSAGAGNGEPSSAAAAIAAGAGDGGAGDGKPGAGDGNPSAGAGSGKPKDVDLAKTSDEEYAKLVQPDVEGEEVDRSLITPMVKELKEAGIQPRTMATVLGIYRKAVAAEIEKDRVAREARNKELVEKCLKEISDDEKRDFAAAYAEHIVKDESLRYVVDHTELGSNPAFIRLIALAGATLRVESEPPASATAGSSQTDLDRRIFERTVPKDLR